MPKVFLTKTERGFIPSTEADEEITNRIALGEEAQVEFRKARNSQFHRKFFAMLKTVFENQTKYSNLEDLLVEIKVRTGHYREHIAMSGEIIYLPKSISFEKMDNIEFEKFYSAAVNAILDGKIVEMDRDDLMLRVLDFF